MRLQTEWASDTKSWSVFPLQHLSETEGTLETWPMQPIGLCWRGHLLIAIIACPVQFSGFSFIERPRGLELPTWSIARWRLLCWNMIIIWWATVCSSLPTLISISFIYRWLLQLEAQKVPPAYESKGIQWPHDVFLFRWMTTTQPRHVVMIRYLLLPWQDREEEAQSLTRCNIWRSWLVNGCLGG